MQTKVVPLGNQIQQFALVRGNLTEVIGPEATDSMLSKSFFLISVGSNDLFDYVNHTASSQEPLDVYLNTLQFTYHDHLKVYIYIELAFSFYINLDPSFKKSIMAESLQLGS